MIKKVVGGAKAVEADNEALSKEFARSIESLTAVLLGKGDPNSKIKIKLRVPKVIKLNLKAKIFMSEVKVGGIEKDRFKGFTMYVVQQGRLKKKLDPGEIYRKGRLYVPLTSKEMKALRDGKLSIFIYNKGNVKGDHVTSKVKKK